MKYLKRLKNPENIVITSHAVDRWIEDNKTLRIKYKHSSNGKRQEKAISDIRKLINNCIRKKWSNVFGNNTYKCYDWFLCIKNNSLVTMMHKYSHRRDI